MTRHARFPLLITVGLALTACTADPGALDEGSHIDSCLLGSWRQDSMTQEGTAADGQTTVATGWSGRVLEFREDGTELVDYAEATPVVAVLPDGTINSTSTWTGTTVYEISTEDGVLTFESVDFANTSVVYEADGETTEFQPEGNSPPVTYTCDETSHTQHVEGYTAGFTRVS